MQHVIAKFKHLYFLQFQNIWTPLDQNVVDITMLDEEKPFESFVEEQRVRW